MVEAQKARIRANLRAQIESSIRKAESRRGLARAAYLAICLDMAGELAAENPGAWQRAVRALEDYPQVLENLYDRAPGTRAQEKLQARATAAGLEPATKKTGPQGRRAQPWGL